eukprot:GHVL01001432.1.p1 GENE.GHVL01001432.1~~GHVL01001432.1.p1  ORF type:complete len:103 (+),score=6.92 GHVL01001432.1:597-905(+)
MKRKFVSSKKNEESNNNLGVKGVLISCLQCNKTSFLLYLQSESKIPIYRIGNTIGRVQKCKNRKIQNSAMAQVCCCYLCSASATLLSFRWSGSHIYIYVNIF